MRAFTKCGLLPVALIVLPGVLRGDGILIEKPAAFVNESVITMGDVQEIAQPVYRQLRDKFEGDELKERARSAYEEGLNSLIERRLAIDSYEAQEQKIPDTVFESRVKDIIRNMFGGNRASLMAVLSERHMTFDEWRNEVREHVIVASMRRANVGENVKISPRAVRKFYDENPGKHRIPEKVKVRMIVLRKRGTEQEMEEKQRLAERIRDQIKTGDDFAALARKFSEGSRAQEGGDWGWIEPRILRKELAEAAIKQEIGNVGEIMETPDELYLLRVEGRKAASIAAFEDAQAEIEQKLRDGEEKVLYGNWIGRLRKDAYVKITDDAPF